MISVSVQSAVGFEHKEEVQQHASQKGRSHFQYSILTNCYLTSRVSFTVYIVSDYSKGFGGKYGVEKEKFDKAALGYDYKGETEKHQSQKGEFKL